MFPPLDELRRSLLAVIVGNPVFTVAEQLHAAHEAGESDSPAHLAQWLRALRLEDAQRGFRARNQAARSLAAPAVCLVEAAQQQEIAALLCCRCLRPYQQRLVGCLVRDGRQAPTTRLAFLGYGYSLLLKNLGRYLAPPRGFAALFDN